MGHYKYNLTSTSLGIEFGYKIEMLEKIFFLQKINLNIFNNFKFIKKNN